jgi:hypothetical protein
MAYLPYVYFGVLKFGDHYLFGNNDDYHNMGRYSLQTNSGARKVQWGDVFSDFTASLNGGLSVQAYSNSDVQSNKQAAQKLNSGHLTDHWSSFGSLVTMLVNALSTSAWMAGDIFTKQQMYINVTWIS